MELILASTSPYRRALLERLRVPFRCVAPGVDESGIHNRGLSPREVAKQLAVLKATAVAERFPQAIVIGGDQVAALGDRIFNKPGTREAAIAQLRALSSRPHHLITAICVQHGDRVLEHCDEAVLLMRDLRDAEIERYVAADAPLDCAGSYKLESLGITLFERIEARDQTAITGLPLLALCRMLRELGVELP